MRGRVAAWELAEPGGIEAIEPALERLYGSGRRRMRRAARAGGPGGRRLHEWRKRVKDLRYAAEMLQRKQEPPGKRLRDRAGAETDKRERKRARKSRRQFIAQAARRADDLGELLGQEHDLMVLAQRVRAEAKATRASGAPGAGHAQGVVEGDRQAAPALAQASAARRRAPVRAQAEELRAPRARGADAGSAQSTLRMVSSRVPLGSATDALSPCARPSSATATGDSAESLPSAGAASCELTMRQVCSTPF